MICNHHWCNLFYKVTLSGNVSTEVIKKCNVFHLWSVKHMMALPAHLVLTPQITSACCLTHCTTSKTSNALISLFHLSMLSISNCNLLLQMCQTLLRTSSAHQLARTLPSSHGTLPPLTVELQLKVPLKHAASNVHIWCLPPRRKDEFKFHFVYYIAIFLKFFLNDVELFLTTSPYVDPASSRVPDGEEEDWLAQMDEAQLWCLWVHHIRG